jgi:hypothetical protein
MKKAQRKAARQEKKFQRIVAIAQTWQARGDSAEAIACGIWNNWGYSTDVRDGQVNIYGGTGSQTILKATL